MIATGVDPDSVRGARQTFALLSMVAASCVWAAEPPDQAAETNSVHAVSEQRAENPERPVAQSEVEDTPVTQQRAPLEPGKKLTLQQKRIFVLGLESNSMP